MRELNEHEFKSVAGGLDLLNGKEVGKAVGNFVQSVGQSVSEAVKETVDSWLPIAKKINKALGAPGS